jgi:hypothetical protein
MSKQGRSIWSRVLPNENMLLLLLLLLLQDINWEKIRYMTNRLGLQAWHVNAPALRPLVSACCWLNARRNPCSSNSSGTGSGSSSGSGSTSTSTSTSSNAWMHRRVEACLYRGWV